MDRITKAVRSKNMSAIRSKGTKSTEVKLRCSLVGSGISHWHMHDKYLPGKPDFVFDDYKLAVFVDGCFWHICPKCYQRPASSQKYWDNKAKINIERDRKSRERLKQMGWLSVCVWEHELNDLARVKRIINQAIEHQKKNLN